MRVFISIDVPGKIKKSLAQLQSILNGELENENVRWEKPEKMHLTVLFIGELGEEKITGEEIPTEEDSRIITKGELVVELENVIREEAEGVRPVKPGIAGIRTFPNNRWPRVIMADVEDPTGAYAELQERLFNKLKTCGFPCSPPKPPHITIARVRKGSVDLPAVELQGSYSFEVREISIKESILRPTGAIHKTISTLVFPSHFP